jgi:two-component system chemotaxis sensor kinase CheA
VIDLQSEEGIGTKFTVTLPITLAIISALIVKVADQQFAIPLANVQEAVWLEDAAARIIDGRDAVTLRGSTLQICHLARLFNLNEEAPGTGGFGSTDAPPMSSGAVGPPSLGRRNDSIVRQDYAAAAFPYRPAHDPNSRGAMAGRQMRRKYVVVTAVGTRRLGLVVDSLVGEQDVVIKPLGPSIKNVPGFAGATELADQRIALVLDAPALVEEMFANEGRSRMHGGTHGF